MPQLQPIRKLYPQDVDLYADWHDEHASMRARLILSQLDRYAQTYVSIFAGKRAFLMAKNSYSNALEFVNCTLTTEQDQDFKNWYISKEHLADRAIEQAFADDYRVSMSWDGHNQCFIASLTFKGEKGENKNKCLTARSDSWLESIAMAVYKHAVLFKGGEWQNVGNGNQRG